MRSDFAAAATASSPTRSAVFASPMTRSMANGVSTLTASKVVSEPGSPWMYFWVTAP